MRCGPSQRLSSQPTDICGRTATRVTRSPQRQANDVMAAIMSGGGDRVEASHYRGLGNFNVEGSGGLLPRRKRPVRSGPAFFMPDAQLSLGSPLTACERPPITCHHDATSAFEKRSGETSGAAGPEIGPEQFHSNISEFCSAIGNPASEMAHNCDHFATTSVRRSCVLTVCAQDRRLLKLNEHSTLPIIQ